MRTRIVSLVFLCFLLASFPVFAGGSGQAAATQQIDIRCGGSSIGGIFYVMSAAIASVVNKHVPEVDFTVQTTAGGLESYNRLVRGTLETYVQNADLAYMGWHGGNPEIPTLVPSRNIRHWFTVEASPMLSVARADNTSVTSFEDLWRSGVRIGTRARGNTPHTLLLNLTRYMGFDETRLNIHAAGHDQSATALRDRNIDVLFAGSGTLSGPNSAYQELASGIRVRMFSFPDNLRTRLVNEFPYWGKFTLPPGWLEGHDQPTDVVGILNAFYIAESVPDEIVHKMTKAVFENLHELVEISPIAFGNLNSRTGAVDAVIPIHPGAMRYFRENNFEISWSE